MKDKVINDMLHSVGNVFKAAASVLEPMVVGDRVQMKELTKTVALSLAMDPKKVEPLVNHFVHETDLAHVARGKKGGIVRGPRVEKAAKTVKNPRKAKNTVTDSTVTDSESNSTNNS